MGHLYIFSNSVLPEIIKVGFTDKHPEVRANDLNRQTGTAGKYAVEWSIQVDEARLAETHAHKCLKAYHKPDIGKEIFQVSLFQAVELIIAELQKRALISDSNEIYEGKFLKGKKKLELIAEKLNGMRAELENLEDIEDDDYEEEEKTLKRPRSSEQKLVRFLGDICESYKGKSKIKATGHHKNAFQYVARLLRKNHEFDVLLANDSNENYVTPISLMGIKHRGYFHQIMLIKVIVSEHDYKLSINEREKQELRSFAKFVKDQFLEFEFYENLRESSLVFTVGYAMVKKTGKHFLQNAEIIDVIYSNVPKQKQERIEELVTENHYIRNSVYISR